MKDVCGRYNKLIPQRCREASPILDESRCSGRTTAIALRALAHAVSNPGTAISIRDHYPTSRADRYAAERVLGIANRLGLRYIKVDMNRLTVTSDIYTDDINEVCP